MKNKLIALIAFVLFVSGLSRVSAQSDYETVENFKKEMRQIEQAIKSADSLGALQEIDEDIDQFQSEYQAHKELLDNSLYPDNFQRSIDKLRNSNNTRKADFTQITQLNTTVTGLKEEIDTLTARNDELAAQFAELENTSSRRIADLERAVANLRASLAKRDQIVMNMITDLLPPNYEEGEELSSQEKQEIVSEAEKNNVLFNIKRAVNDNIRFLDATRLYAEDLRKVKAQQENFVRIWKNAGPTIVGLYAQKGKSTDEFNEIDEAFRKWNDKINQEVWSSINAEFAENNIRLRQFSNGDEFVITVSDYIDDEIMNSEAKDDADAEQDYKNFVDSTWSEDIENSWLPFLVDNRMITENQEDSLEVKIDSWRAAVYPGEFNWLYVIIGVLAVAVIVLLFTRRPVKIVKEKPLP